MLANDRSEFLDFDLVGGGARVLVGGVEVAGTGAGPIGRPAMPVVL